MSKPRLLDLFCGAGGAAMGMAVIRHRNYDFLGGRTARAWAAGFFDGEGSISAYRDRRPGRRPGIQLSIEQTDERPLLRFKSATGWHGNVVARPAPRAPNRRRLYRIFATNDAALGIIAALWPWLSEPKQEQALRVLADVTGNSNVAA